MCDADLPAVHQFQRFCVTSRDDTQPGIFSKQQLLQQSVPSSCDQELQEQLSDSTRTEACRGSDESKSLCLSSSAGANGSPCSSDEKLLLSAQQSDTQETSVVPAESTSLLSAGLSALFCGTAGAAAISSSHVQSSTVDAALAEHLHGMDISFNKNSIHRYPHELLQVLVQKSSRADVLYDKETDSERTKNGNMQASALRSSEMTKSDFSENSIGLESNVVNGSSLKSVQDSIDNSRSDPVANGHGCILTESESFLPAGDSVGADGNCKSTSIQPIYNSVSTLGRSDASEDQEEDRLSTVWSDVSGLDDDIVSIRALLNRCSPRSSDMVASASADDAKHAVTVDCNDSPETKCTSSAVVEELQLVVRRQQLQLSHAVRERDLLCQQLVTVQRQIAGDSSGVQRRLLDSEREAARLSAQLDVVQQQLQAARTECDSLRRTQQSSEPSCTDEASWRQERRALVDEVAALKQRLAVSEENAQRAVSRTDHAETELRETRHRLCSIETDMREAGVQLEEARGVVRLKEMSVEQLTEQLAGVTAALQQGVQDKLVVDAELEQTRQRLRRSDQTTEWCRSQLHEAQQLRISGQQQLAACQAEMLVVKGQCERFNLDAANHAQDVETIRARALREKESLLRHLEDVRQDMVHREQLLDLLRENRNSDETAVFERLKEAGLLNSQLINQDLAIKELRQHVDTLKCERDALSEKLRRMKMEGEERALQLVSCQEKLRQQTSLVETLRARDDRVLQDCSALQSQLCDQDAVTVELRQSKSQLEAALVAATRERRDIDSAVARLDGELSKAAARFCQLKRDMHSKESEVQRLNTLLADRDRSLSAAARQAQELERVKTALRESGEKVAIFDTMNEQNKSLMVKNHQLECKLQQATQDRSVLEQMRVKLEDVVKQLQQQNNQLATDLGLHKTAVISREQTIVSLQDDMKQMRQEMLVVKSFARKLHRQNEDRASISSAVSPFANEDHINDVSIDISSPNADNMKPAAVSASVSETSECRQQTECGVGNATSKFIEYSTKTDANVRGDSSSLSSSAAFSPDTSAQENECQTERSSSDRLDRQPQHQHVEGCADTSASDERFRTESNSCQAGDMRCIEKNTKLSVESASERSEGLCSRLENLSVCAATQTTDFDDRDAASLKWRELARRYRSNIRLLTRKLAEYARTVKRLETCPEARHGQTELVELEEQLVAARRHADQLRVEVQQRDSWLAELRDKCASVEQLQLELNKQQGRCQGVTETNSALQRQLADLQALTVGYEQQQTVLVERSACERRQLENRCQQLQDQLTQAQHLQQQTQQQLCTEQQQLCSTRQLLNSARAGHATAEQLLEERGHQLSSCHEQLALVRRQLDESGGRSCQLEQQLQAATARHGELQQQHRANEDNQHVLTQQIKTLNMHLQQKSAELRASQQQAEFSEQRHNSQLQVLQSKLNTADEQARVVLAELHSCREQRHQLQDHCTQLTSALQDVRGQLVRAEQQQDTDELPSPRPLDTASVARLMELCRRADDTSAPWRPLDQLQTCLSSLHREMDALKSDFARNTMVSSSRTASDGGTSGNASGTSGNNSGTSGNDSGTSGNDSGTGGNDSGTSGNVSGTSGNDSGTSGKDSGTSGNASGTSGNDSGTSGNGSGTGGNNSGAGGNDSGTSGNDSGTSGNGSGTGGNNSGTGGNDSGTSGNDSGTCGNVNVVSGNDSVTGGNDSGTCGNDIGTSGNDSGTSGNDSGICGNDSGTSGNDSGICGNDSGTSGNASGTSGNDSGTCGNANTTSGNDSGTSGNANATSGNDSGTSGNDSGTSGNASGTGGNDSGTGGNASVTSGNNSVICSNVDSGGVIGGVGGVISDGDIGGDGVVDTVVQNSDGDSTVRGEKEVTTSLSRANSCTFNNTRLQSYFGS